MRGASIRVALAIVITGVGSVGPGRSVLACSCVEATDDEQFELASVVFAGTVVDDWSQPPPETGEYSSDLPRWLTFETTEVYKGEVFELQSIRTIVDGAACGLELRGTGPFLMFAIGSGTEYQAGLCGGSRPLAPGGVPPSFGGPAPPSPGASFSTRPDTSATTIPPDDEPVPSSTAAAEPAPATTSASPTSSAPENRPDGASGPGVPVAPIVIGGLALAVLFGAGALMRTRRRST